MFTPSFHLLHIRSILVSFFCKTSVIYGAYFHCRIVPLHHVISKSLLAASLFHFSRLLNRIETSNSNNVCVSTHLVFLELFYTTCLHWFIQQPLMFLSAWTVIQHLLRLLHAWTVIQHLLRLLHAWTVIQHLLRLLCAWTVIHHLLRLLCAWTVIHHLLTLFSAWTVKYNKSYYN